MAKCEGGCGNPPKLCNGVFPHDPHDFEKAWLKDHRHGTYHCPGTESEIEAVQQAGTVTE